MPFELTHPLRFFANHDPDTYGRGPSGAECNRKVTGLLKILATGTISGHEARGRILLVRAADGTLKIEIQDLWVSPGAPDVRLYLSARADGQMDHSAIDLGHVPPQQALLSRPVPRDIVINDIKSVIIFCKMFAVHFGSGALARLDAS